MLTELDNFYLTKPEPNKSCLLALRDIILQQDEEVACSWKYRLPFFTYKKKMFCYLWIDKKTTHPYIGFVEGGRMDNPMLVQGDRKRMKVLPVDPNLDIQVELITRLVNEALDFYRLGVIKVKPRN